MKMVFKQRFFSWLDSYDVYDEEGKTLFTVQGKMAWGHRLEVYNASGKHIGTLKEEVFTFMPRFNIYLGNNCLGSIKKEFTFLKPSFHLDYNGWRVEGDFWEWEYDIVERGGNALAHVSKQLFNFMDTYSIDVKDEEDAITCLMIVLAIDAAKCSAGNS